MALIMTSSVFAFLLGVLEALTMLADTILAISDNPVISILAINALLLMLGMLMDMGVLILLLTPILLPVAAQLGIDPIHFGINMLVNLGIGVCTPPVGSSLLVGCAVGNVSVEKTVGTLAPLYIIMIGVLLLVTFMPQLTLFLPRLLD